MTTELIKLRGGWICEGESDEIATRLRISFPNGYSASIVRGLGTYGSEGGLFELAVLHGGHLCYDTPITDDVIGHLTKEEVIELCDKIASLPAK